MPFLYHLIELDLLIPKNYFLASAIASSTLRIDWLCKPIYFLDVSDWAKYFISFNSSYHGSKKYVSLFLRYCSVAEKLHLSRKNVRKKGNQTMCWKSDASCSWSNHLDRLRKVGGCIYTTGTHHSYWYAIWVQTSAISINKAQGQSLEVAGINLETHFFSHGQLYVEFQELELERICMYLLLMRKLKTLSIKKLCNKKYVFQCT